jgi:xanthine dehydrogenase small subunit
MSGKTLRFIKNGQCVQLDNVPADRMLLEIIREDLHCTGTKEGCGEGDCGACTVVLANLEQGHLSFRAVNSCIRFAHSIEGQALFTVEDLQGVDGQLHPVQQAMVDQHATQCGFCTPGFIMSLFGMYQNTTLNDQLISRAQAETALAGNLCRCTGYRPILDAAQQLHHYPKQLIATEPLVGALNACKAQRTPEDSVYLQPESLADLLNQRARHPDAQLIAGSTDVGLWINKLHRRAERVIDVSQTHELRQIKASSEQLFIGAAVPLSDAFREIANYWPALAPFLNRFAGLPIRQSATLGGNIANGSPIGDTMPLLIAMNASLHLQSVRGSRVIPIEEFFLGYRKTLLGPDEVITTISIPLPSDSKARHAAAESQATREFFLDAFKISKRFDDDISAVCLAIGIELHGGSVRQVSIGVGGVAATPVKAARTEAALRGQPWTQPTIDAAATALDAEFTPISDMRASALYRQSVMKSLLHRFWLQTQRQYLTLNTSSTLNTSTSNTDSDCPPQVTMPALRVEKGVSH